MFDELFATAQIYLLVTEVVKIIAFNSISSGIQITWIIIANDWRFIMVMVKLHVAIVETKVIGFPGYVR